MIKASVDFSKKLRPWDGFGVNYVETSQTPNYIEDPQEYGGFSLLSKDKRQEIIQLIFGNDGLKPGVIKMFLDPFHQEECKQNNSDPSCIDQSNYDHETTTKWMRYFVREGLKVSRERGRDLEVITTLYGPPAWMTNQKFMRGRDIDPDMKLECAKYMVSWAKYLREHENIPVKYISLHNEGEDYHRWPEDGSSGNIGTGHDYNMYWPPEQVSEFLKLMRNTLDMQGMNDVGVTPGETSNWQRFYDWGYADAIGDDIDAVESLGLITSHGFYNGSFGAWYGDHRSAGIDLLQEKKPSLHSWVTSTSWSKMDAFFIYEMRGNIYSAKNNAIIPWACIQRPKGWVGGDPNPGTAFRVYDDGTYSVEKGYYFYKQICRAGQPGMSVARAISTDSAVGVIAFAGEDRAQKDALLVINISKEDKNVSLTVDGSSCCSFEGCRTSPCDDYVNIGALNLKDGKLTYTAPPMSVTTFYGK